MMSSSSSSSSTQQHHPLLSLGEIDTKCLCQLIALWGAPRLDNCFFYTTAILKSCCQLSPFNLGNYPKLPKSCFCLDLDLSNFQEAKKSVTLLSFLWNCNYQEYHHHASIWKALEILIFEDNPPPADSNVSTFCKKSVSSKFVQHFLVNWELLAE